jgi:hypothetical protein
MEIRMNSIGWCTRVAAVLIAAAQFGFGQTATLAVSPSVTIIAPAEVFSVNVTIAGVTDLHAANIRMVFQHSIIRYRQATQGSFLERGFMPSPFISNGPSHDTVTLDQAILGPGGQTGSGTLLSLFFTAIVGGTTPIDLVSADLRSATNAQIPGLLSDGEVIVDPALPVILVSFTAEPTATGHVWLRWRTTSEVNNYGFVVQRREDQNESFADLPNSFQSGHGTTTETHDYSFVDAAASPGQWYYRLKQIDTHLGEHFSCAVTVSARTGMNEELPPSHFGLQQNYPNPFNPGTAISYDLPAAGPVRIVIVSALGQPITDLVNGVQSAGRHVVRWDGTTAPGSRAASGPYFCVMKAGDFTSVRKMLMVK